MITYFILLYLVLFDRICFSQEAVIHSNSLDEFFVTEDEGDNLSTDGEKIKKIKQEKVQIKIYYESLCPDCREFDTQQLAPTIRKIGQYLDLRPYPYGNAETIDNNGKYEFKCQHGPAECYGNMLHACAIDLVHNMSSAVLYNTCMMAPQHSGRGSDDNAADHCGKKMGIDSGPIKQCAKSDKGLQLLKYYGDESKKVHYDGVPYILINDVENDGGDSFFNDVCEAFKNPPAECTKQPANSFSCISV